MNWKKRDLIGFYFFLTQMRHGDVFSWWNEEFASFLDLFFKKKLQGKRPIALLESPPQHGKTTMILVFIAWVLGFCPKMKILYLSANVQLGVDGCKKVESMMNSERYASFFGWILDGKNTQEHLSTKEGGGLRSMSLGGTFVGQSADLVIIDDPYKDREEAHSEIIREKVWRSFGSDVLSRLSNEGAVLVVATRWHVKDLTAMIKKHHPEAMVFSYPAIATHHEKHRKKGEALHPALKSLEFLRRQESLMHQGDFEALYQQNPGVYSEALFKRAWFLLYDEPPQGGLIFIVADTAFKTGAEHDYSVFLVWMKKGEKLYLLEMLRDKWEGRDLYAVMKDLMQKYEDAIIYIEDKASGIALIQEGRREFSDYRVAARKRRAGKVQRALDVLSFAASERVYLPKNRNISEEFLEEVLAFNTQMTHEHDDIVDALVDALSLSFVEEDGDRQLQAWVRD